MGRSKKVIINVNFTVDYARGTGYRGIKIMFPTVPQCVQKI